MPVHELLVDIHSHTWVSDCGLNTHLEMVEAAAMCGLQALAITDHGPKLGGGMRRNFVVRFGGQWKGIRVLRGIEANTTPEGTDTPPWLISRFDIILAGLHMDGPCADPYRNSGEVIRVIETCPYVDVITHPLRRSFPLDVSRVAPVAAEHGVCLELNNATIALGRCDREAAVAMVRLCRDNGYRIAVGSDAHTVSEVGKFDEALSILDELDFPHELVVNRTLESATAWLEERRPLKVLPQ